MIRKRHLNLRKYSIGLLLAIIPAMLFLTTAELLSHFFLLNEKEKAIGAEKLLDTFLSGQNLRANLLLGCKVRDTFRKDPLFGFSPSRTAPCGNPNFKDAFTDSNAIPEDRNTNRFFILMTGGSVSFNLNMEKGKYLENELNRHYIPPKGKSFVVLNAAVAAWKLPNQINAALLYAHRVDAVVSLDGFNELYSNTDLKLHHPEPSYYYAVQRQNIPFSTHLKLWFASLLTRSTHAINVLKKSSLIYHLISKLVFSADADFKKEIASYQNTEEFPSHYKFPENVSKNEKFKLNIKQYLMWTGYFSQVVKSSQTKFFHFLQPVVHIGKPLTQNEKYFFNQNLYEHSLLLEKEYKTALDNKLFPGKSLMRVYENNSEDIFADAVHPIKDFDTGESHGYEILAKNIALALHENWHLKKISKN